MNAAVHNLNVIIGHGKSGHFVIRNNGLYVYDRHDDLRLHIPSYLLQTTPCSAGKLRQGIRHILKSTSTNVAATI